MAMLEQIPGDQRVTAGADKEYDTRDSVAEWPAEGYASAAVAVPLMIAPRDTATRSVNGSSNRLNRVSGGGIARISSL